MHISSCPAPVPTSRAEDNFQYNFSTLVFKICSCTWAAGPGDPLTLSKPSTKLSTAHSSHQGATSECQIPKTNLGYQVFMSKAEILTGI